MKNDKFNVGMGICLIALSLWMLIKGDYLWSVIEFILGVLFIIKSFKPSFLSIPAYFEKRKEKRRKILENARR